MQFFSVFLNKTKKYGFLIKNVDVSRNQGFRHVIYTVFGPSLGKL